MPEENELREKIMKSVRTKVDELLQEYGTDRDHLSEFELGRLIKLESSLTSITIYASLRQKSPKDEL